MEISQFAYIPLLLMLFSVLAVVRGWPENTFMLFKKHLDHFFQLEITIHWRLFSSMLPSGMAWKGRYNLHISSFSIVKGKHLICGVERAVMYRRVKGEGLKPRLMLCLCVHGIRSVRPIHFRRPNADRWGSCFFHFLYMFYWKCGRIELWG